MRFIEYIEIFLLFVGNFFVINMKIEGVDVFCVLDLALTNDINIKLLRLVWNACGQCFLLQVSFAAKVIFILGFSGRLN